MSAMKLLSSKKNAVIVFLISSVIILLSSFFYLQNIRNTIIKDIKNELKSLSGIKQLQITESYQDEINDAKLLASNEFFLSEFTDLLKRKSSPSKRIKNYLNEVKLEHGYEDVLVIDKVGKILVNTIQGSPELSENIIQLLNRNKSFPTVFCSDFYYCEKHERLHIDFISEIFLNGEKKGYLVCRKNPDDLLKQFYEITLQQRKTLEVVLIRKEGKFAAPITRLANVKNPTLSIKVPITKHGLAGVEAIKGQKKFFWGKDYTGKDILSYLSPVKNTNWFIVTKIYKSEINDIFYSEIKFFIFFLIVFLIGIFFFVFWFYHYSQRNLYRQLYLEEKESQEKNEEYEAILYSIGDAVITTDKSGKIKNMNPVAEELTGWSESEAIGREIKTVFNIVNENTRQAVESPVEKVFRENRVVGLANHTLLISKDGKEIPIADSGAPVCDEDGKPIGVVLVFRDQSFEREAKRKIEESEFRYKQFVHFSNDGIWRFDTTEKIPITLPVDEQINLFFEHGYLAECNDVFAQMYGFENAEPLIGTKLRDLLIPDDPANIEYLKNFIGNNYRLHKAESIEIDKDGNKKYFLNSLVGIIEDGYLIRAWGTQDDVTELKQLQEARQKSEERLQRGELVSKSGNWELDLNTKLMHASEGAAKIYGVDKTMLTYDYVKSVPLPEYRELLDNALIDLIKNNKPYDVEFKIKAADTGQIKDIHSIAIYDKDRNTLFGVIQDITELKLVENKLRESEANLQSLINFKDQSMWSLDENLHLIICNDYFRNAYKAAYNYDLQIGVNLVEILPPHLRKIWEPKYHEALAGNRVVFEFSEVILGKRFYFEIILNPIYYENKIKGVSALSVDITELVETRKALEESEENYRTIFNASTEAIFVDDATTGKMIDVNDAVVKMYGYSSKEEILSGDIGNLSANIGNYNESTAQELIRKCIEEGPQSFEWRAKRKDGSLFWIEMHLKKTIVNGKEIILAVGRDIDERKKAEEKILEQLNELRRWQNVMLDREDRVIELKNEVNELLAKLGKEKKYFNE